MRKSKQKISIMLILIVVGSLILIVMRETRQDIKENAARKPSVVYTNCFEKKVGIAVLCYHRVLKKTETTEFISSISEDKQLHEYNIWLSEFEQQMKFLEDNNIPILTVDQLLERINSKTITEKAVVITFDDVDKTLVENAYPVLNALSIPFVQFIITGQVGNTIDGCKTADWKDIIKMNKNPLVTTGLQTHNLHYQKNYQAVLSTNISKERMREDFETSQNVMLQKINEKGNYFAYPYGVSNPYLDRYMQENEIRGIFTLTSDVVTNNTTVNSIPRLLVTKDNWKKIQEWCVPSS